MNTKRFIVGKRYWDNAGSSTYTLIGRCDSRSGDGYLTFRSDKNWVEVRRRIHETNGEEWIDKFAGAVKGITIYDKDVIRASCETDYIVPGVIDEKFMAGEEIEIPFGDLKYFADKTCCGDSSLVKISLVK